MSKLILAFILAFIGVCAALAMSPAAGAAKNVSASRSTDAAAVKSFVSVAFGGAPDNFSSLRGRKVDLDEFTATKWPDRVLFQSCHTWHFTPDSTLGISESYGYSCNSTRRALSREALFKIASKAVAAAGLPSGYASKGPEKRSDGSAFQEWKRGAGDPTLKLWSFDDHGKSYYELYLEKSP